MLIFLKALFYFISLTNFHHILVNDEQFEKFRNILTNILDFLLVLMALFILFLRKNNSIFAISLAIIVLFKAFIRVFVEYKLYKYTNLSNNTINYIKEYELKSVFISNAVLSIVTIYILTQIF
jgi:hypothetical protein